MPFAGPEESAARRAAFQEWAAVHGLIADDAVRFIHGVMAGVRIRVDTGITDRGHWPIIVDVTGPLDHKERLRDLPRAHGMPRSLTSIAPTRAGARLRFQPTARLDHIEAVIASLPRSDRSTRPYR